MTDQLTIAMAQINQRVGDLSGNAAAMLAWRAKAPGADLIVFPEQQLIGYPAEDLVLKPVFAAKAAAQLAELALATADGGPAMLARHVAVSSAAASWATAATKVAGDMLVNVRARNHS